MAEVAPSMPSMMTVDGTFHIPDGAPRPEYIPPDTVVLQTAARYGFLMPNMRGIDPFAGTGTIPRVINEAGGDCMGIEIDPVHHAIAKRETPDTTIILGDCTEVYLPEYEQGFHYIYTSPPFDLIVGHTEVMDKVISAFNRMMRPGGLVVIDSADAVLRDGIGVYPAAATIQFFGRYGFHLVEARRFSTVGVGGSDNQFTELAFTRL